MQAAEFLDALAKPLKKLQPPKSSSSQDWTVYMTQCLFDAAKKHLHVHMCSRTLQKVDGPPKGSLTHMSKEFLYDITLYASANWEDWSLPDVIVEHENHHSHQAFLWDFWKLLTGHAPLRVMFGYANGSDGVEERVKLVHNTAAKSKWQYPNDSEDLVIVRAPNMTWSTWRVLYRRRKTKTWVEYGPATLDEIACKI
ncbi:MAG TPA: hypothetical protein PK156_16065 [Polyangium sp.]|nr:hypothetical protein [Polyangium sp.]